jgi:hypothetical protein
MNIRQEFYHQPAKVKVDHKALGAEIKNQFANIPYRLSERYVNRE